MKSNTFLLHMVTREDEYYFRHYQTTWTRTLRGCPYEIDIGEAVEPPYGMDAWMDTEEETPTKRLVSTSCNVYVEEGMCTVPTRSDLLNGRYDGPLEVQSTRATLNRHIYDR